MQLGTKVPLWGGFNAQGGFALKLWTPKAKMTKEDWKEHIPALKRAAALAGAGHGLSCCTVVFGLDKLLWTLHFTEHLF